jgi:hypothetical protein
MAHITDDVPSGVVWIRDGWVGLNHLTSGDAVLTGDALSLLPFSVGQADYCARVQVARSFCDAGVNRPGWLRAGAAALETLYEWYIL